MERFFHLDPISTPTFGNDTKTSLQSEKAIRPSSFQLIFQLFNNELQTMIQHSWSICLVAHFWGNTRFDPQNGNLLRPDGENVGEILLM